MSRIGEKVRRLLTNHPDGLTARQMATLLDESKSEINSFLYYDSDFSKDANNVWTISNSQSYCATDPVLQKLNNYENAVFVSQEDFDNLCDWSVCCNHSDDARKIKYTTKTGNIIFCDSKSEYLMLSYLEGNDLVIACGGQSLPIRYDSEFRTGRTYYPDIVALTKDNHIAMIEVKPLDAMSYHINLYKYTALQQYCEEHGYTYMMIDPDNEYMTFDDLRDMPMPTTLYFLSDDIRDTSKKRGVPDYFDVETVDKWYAEYGEGITKKKFYLMIHSLIINYGWHNKFKHGFSVYTEPVKIDNDFNVIG